MCGRYSLTKLESILRQFDLAQSAMSESPRYNIAPTQPVLGIANDYPDRLEHFHWGLIPSWATDPSIGSRMINARAETLTEKPAFRRLFRRQRCLIAADGFYEWRKEPGGKKTPMYIRLKNREPFAFAGLWDRWRDVQGKEIRSCTLITAEPNELVKPIHNRMVVMLPKEHYRQWLSPEEENPDRLRPLLKPYPAEEMEAFAVARTVNSPGNETAGCIEPIVEEAEESQPSLWDR